MSDEVGNGAPPANNVTINATADKAKKQKKPNFKHQYNTRLQSESSLDTTSITNTLCDQSQIDSNSTLGEVQIDRKAFEKKGSQA